MIDLRYPWLLLLLLPAFWFAWRAPYRWGIPHERPTSRLERVLAHAVPSALAALLVIAASGPEWRETALGRAPVVDFAVVLDGSSSMRALDDGREDRWSAARRELKSFIAGRPDDRFALVLFSGHPVTLSPLTADHVRIFAILERLELGSRDDGTAIGSALMTAVRRLADSPARSRVILLLTDGAQNRGRVTALEAAEEARDQGIRIHTVALGGQGESLYPIEGGGYARIRVDTDPETLRQVARLTGGEALAAGDRQGLARSLAAVDRLEKTALPVDPPSEGRPLARGFLMAAFLLVLPLTYDLLRKRGTPRPSWLEDA
ncbi:MAG TPA: VWA domain-containing protein [Holophaga sp.]|nr:VWA domain-containing protein [Holophaga sp.]HPS67484.1 VWA domain-containing protein [Holophaga sp.]